MLFFINSAKGMHLYISAFKYISCYSLSIVLVEQIFCQSIFKYISCYSLSATLPGSSLGGRYLNTSHVILYPAVGTKVTLNKGI